MKYLTYIFALLLGTVVLFYSCDDDADDEGVVCVQTTWFEDADGDGLGNPDVSQLACEQPNGFVADNTDTDDAGGVSTITGGTPVSAFDDFNADAVTVSFDGDEITIESNALPNHTSPYWDSSNELFIDAIIADPNTMSPGTIREGSYTLTVPSSPELASASSSTGLGAIGIAISGAPIFNDEEGPNIQLTAQVASGFDYAGGHNGPTGYHYHLESSDIEENTLLSFDDERLVGILQDGFLLYGRRDSETGDYPTDLDESGGHFGPTQHSNGESFYHYHVINEIFVEPYIILFGGDLQGTPNQFM